jgi:16S rRNA processing protein RimM
MDNFIKIGYFKKLHGFKGALLLHLEEGIAFETEKIELLMVEIDGNLAPFFVKELSLQQKVLVNFENVTTETEAKKFIGKVVFANKEILSESDETSPFSEYIGYALIDDVRGNIGKITEIREYPQHHLFVIIINDTEVLLPAVDEFISEIDDDTKTILYKSPEGLIDVYLENS